LHPRFSFSSDVAVFQVEDTRFKVHTHFLTTYSPVFRELLLRQQNGNDASDKGNSKVTGSSQGGGVVYLDYVSVLEFESLLTFFYESWQEGFTMSTPNWVALLAIAHRFKFKDAEIRARREVFQSNRTLDSVKQIVIAEKHSVPVSFIVPALVDLVQRQKPLLEKELMNLSGEMIARLVTARETYVRESSRMFATELWCKEVANNIVKTMWPTDTQRASTSA